MKHHPLEPYITLYLNEKDIKKETKEVYKTILKYYVTYLKTRHIRFACEKDILNYIQFRKSAHISSKWLYHHISVIKGLYQFLSMGQPLHNIPKVYQHNMTEYIKNVKPKAKKPVLEMKIEDVKIFLKCLKDQRINLIDYRDYAIILLMVSTGLRSVEIRRAKLIDIKEVNAKKVLYVQGKGRLDKSEYIKLSNTVLESIDQYLAKRGDTSPFLFISHFRHGNNINVSKAFIYSILKKRAHACNLSHLSLYPHMLRHTAARLHLKSGGTLEETRMLLRHVHIETTLIYTLNSNAFDNKISKHVEDYIFKET